MADYFKERKWHPTQQVKTLKTGDVIVSFRAAGVDEVMSGVLFWGAHATVLGPTELVDDIKLLLKEACKGYAP